MAITAQNIADKAELLLQDGTNIRWTEAEILGWINSGQREILIYKSNANPYLGVHTTAAGSKQELAAGGIQLLDVVRTVGGDAITAIDRRVLDVTIPGWHSQASGPAKHYVFDERFPQYFYLYPPAAASVSIEAVWSKIPTDIASMAGNIFNELYETVLLDYVLYRAYSKDSTHTANATRAQGHYQAFINALTGKTQGEVALAPDSQFATPSQTATPRR